MEEDKLDADEGREEEVECGGLEWSYIFMGCSAIVVC